MIADISETGMRIITGHTCRVGEEIAVASRFDPNDEPIEILCAVRHLRPINPPDRSIALGVEFVNVSAKNRLRILEFIARLTVAPA